MEQPRCQGQTKAGEPCRSFAVKGSAFCIVHDPTRVADVREARAKGGAAAAKLRALKGKRAKLDTLPALVKFTANVIHDVLEGTLPVDVGRCVLYGLSIQKALVETSDLERRVEALEQQIAARVASRKGWRA